MSFNVQRTSSANEYTHLSGIFDIKKTPDTDEFSNSFPVVRLFSHDSSEIQQSENTLKQRIFDVRETYLVQHRTSHPSVPHFDFETDNNNVLSLTSEDAQNQRISKIGKEALDKYWEQGYGKQAALALVRTYTPEQRTEYETLSSNQIYDASTTNISNKKFQRILKMANMQLNQLSHQTILPYDIAKNEGLI